MKRRKMFIALTAVLSLGTTLFLAGCGGSGGGTGDATVQPQATRASEVIAFSALAVETTSGGGDAAFVDPVETVAKNFVPDCTTYDTAGLLATAGKDILNDPESESFTSADGHLTVDYAITNPGNGGWFFDWTNTTFLTVDILAVVVNSNQGGYLYLYDPPLDADSGLHAAAAGQNDVVVWHKPTQVSFCYRLTNGGGNGGTDGCTLGYWGATRGGTNGNGSKGGEVVHQASWDEITVYGTDTTLTAAGFSLPATLADDTLLEALHYKGGPDLEDKMRLLLKQAVAALLNAEHAGVDYPMTATEVVDAVNTALASGDQTDILSLQMTLDAYNNLGCPLN